MIDGLKPYPELKESGIPWAGRVPTHWGARRGKRLFEEAAQPVREGDEIVTCFRDGQVTLRRNRRASGYMVALQEVGYQGVRRGQLVIHAMDAFAGAVGVSDSDGKCTPEYIVCRPREPGLSPAYYAAALRIAAHTNFIQISCDAVRERAPRLRYPNFGEMVLPVPPPDEQALIVRFLDHADRRIRRLIAAKQRMIKLLEEQKRSVVDGIVRGAGQRGRRNSGIDWLGDIPGAWRVARLKTVVGSITSGSRGWSDFAADDGPLFVRIANLTRASLGLRFDDIVRLDLPPSTRAEAQRARLRADDILLSITAFIGSVAVVPDDLGEAYISQHVACCRPRAGAVVPRWAGYVLLSSIGQTHGQLAMNGGTKQGLSLDDVGNYVLVLPPIAEQRALVATIERQTSDLERAIAREADHIPLLREYRTRLISDVVTGTLDVRAAAAALADDAEPVEPLDDAESDDAEDGDEPADEVAE